MLQDDAPAFGSLERKLARATLEHAAENVQAIEELKRARRKGKEAQL